MSLERETPDASSQSPAETLPPYYIAETLDEFVKQAKEKGATAISSGVVFLMETPPEGFKKREQVLFETGLRAITPSGRDVYFDRHHSDRLSADIFNAENENRQIRNYQLDLRWKFVAEAVIVQAYGDLKAAADQMPGIPTMQFSNGKRIDELFLSEKHLPEILEIAIAS